MTEHDLDTALAHMLDRIIGKINGDRGEDIIAAMVTIRDEIRSGLFQYDLRAARRRKETG